MTDTILDIDNLVVALGKTKASAGPRIIDGVSIKVEKGETLCVVGEERAPAGRRQHQTGRRGASDCKRPPPAAASRHHHGDDLPGADDRAEPGRAGRQAD
jgi:peptide/nickel transport system ATP-binding protein